MFVPAAMPNFSRFTCLFVLVLLGSSTLLPVGLLDDKPVYWSQVAMSWLGLGSLFAAALVGFLQRVGSPAGPSRASRLSPDLGATLAFAILGLLGSLAPLVLLDGLKVGEDVTPVTIVPDSYGFWLALLALAVLACLGLSRLAALETKQAWPRHAMPLLLGAWALIFWQIGVQAFEVPRVLLPAPALIANTLLEHWDVLLDDFQITVLHSALIGYIFGCVGGFLLGILIDRSPFLQRGLLPVCALASSVPLVGIAPIMVMWFGFEWHSKAAVVALMTFFPMLVSTFAGLAATGRMELDLMRSFAAGHFRTLALLRLPTAMPFLFNGLKVASTLALIGAIVAEFFGSPTVGMGFRISSEAARMNMGLVWATIVVAALAGTVIYALIEWMERKATFWHPSQRR